MSKSIAITGEDILNHLKLSLQIPEVIQGIMSRKIIINAALEAGIKVETQELQKAANTIRLLQGLHTAEETFTWLEKHCLSVDKFEETAYLSLISQKLISHLFSEKVEPYFNQNKWDYVGVVMYEIMLDDPDLAMKLFSAIEKKKISFYEVAHQYIQDQELRRRGGYRGVLYRQDLKPEIAAAVFAARPPQMIKPIITSEGIYLIFVEEILQAELDCQLRSKILLRLFEEWVKQQVKSVEVVNNF
ncbi:peptidylprolyl isomerase [Limnoraphis robusta Tam1]|jgi:hypothetical protein|uniref:peptidylprolyl isomerase n=1 Tax=Limnoraphis robusta CCNP1315 TaxID=3110306 RepID=A0ABU5U609_9CYAN|nr:peptidylprolyl isomerase [Limnoraphis robusta]MCG5059791.1 peptidylprolyl isomerase [Limnoraphis sp. WC205]MEA5498832.1 peptidylprolyl isomerase [Limnoraphis robusta BA-68 BA1]MEA5522641.1 peptidylprolyl isomerase [Limnoraphis robusta CCNP1315]MEA5541892.1 peptidylprolyl isomerase [Limnoraphis robusta Tam1]MEA5546552.1 peptidylprolyl isomerase [Limnoraphis robusta CCNP1324]